jgi:Leucine-rich repeat (LRR) protein
MINNLLQSKLTSSIECMQVLSLDGNGLEHIYAKAFLGLNGLLSLALQNNNIGYLPSEGLFANMSRLSTLLLRNNHIETIWPKTFIGLRALSRLDLADNRLSTLPDGMLHKSTKLRHIFIDNNRLKTIGRCALTSTKRGQTQQQQQHLAAIGQQQQPQQHSHHQQQNLRTLSATGNTNLLCDCRLTWLLDIRLYVFLAIRATGLLNDLTELNFSYSSTNLKKVQPSCVK